MRSDRKRTILFVIILLVLSLGIGYAFLTTTLTIDGVSDIDRAVWDVHFEYIYVDGDSVSGSQVISPATISADGLSVSYHVKLSNLGDKYIFDFFANNDGTIDAVIDNIIFKINGVDATMAPSYLSYYVMYDCGDTIDIGDYLPAGNRAQYNVGIQYREDVNPEDLPNENTSLDISFQVIYKQASHIPYSDLICVYGFLPGYHIHFLPYVENVTWDEYYDLADAKTKALLDNIWGLGLNIKNSFVTTKCNFVDKNSASSCYSMSNHGGNLSDYDLLNGNYFGWRNDDETVLNAERACYAYID